MGHTQTEILHRFPDASLLADKQRATEEGLSMERAAPLLRAWTLGTVPHVVIGLWRLERETLTEPLVNSWMQLGRVQKCERECLQRYLQKLEEGRGD